MSKTYWNSQGEHQGLADALDHLVPHHGEVDGAYPMLERFRRARNCYYDLYNNGLCNRAKEFAGLFKIRKSDALTFGSLHGNRVEAAMDRFVLEAAAEQLYRLPRAS